MIKIVIRILLCTHLHIHEKTTETMTWNQNFYFEFVTSSHNFSYFFKCVNLKNNHQSQIWFGVQHVVHGSNHCTSI